MNSYRLLVIFVILFGLFLRIYKINIPLTEFYPSRQVQTADITRNFIKNDFNLLKPTVSYLGPGYVPFLLEFPGYNYTVAVLYLIFGVNEIYGRLFSVVGWVVSCLFLYKIALKLCSKTTALAAIVFFTFSPLSVLISRSFQPDEWMLATSLGGTYFFLQWVKSRKTTYLVTSSIFIGLSILIKSPAIFFTLIPVSFYLVFQKEFRIKDQLVFYLVSISPSLLWYGFAYLQKQSSVTTIDGFSFSNWFGWEIFLNPSFYKNIFGFEYNLVILPVGFFLFFLGLMTKVSKEQRFLYWWLTGLISYLLLFNKHNMTHEYYHLPFLPLITVFAGIAVETIWNSYKDFVTDSRLFVACSIVLLFILMFLPTYQRAYSPIDRFSYVKQTATEVEKATLPSELMIGSIDSGSSLVYYSNRHGWGLNLNSQKVQDTLEFYDASSPQVLDTSTQLEQYRNLGAAVFACADKEQFLNNTKFARYMYKNYRIIKETDKYIIFDLRKKVVV